VLADPCMRHAFLLALLVAACGGGASTTSDAGPADAAPEGKVAAFGDASDKPPVTGPDHLQDTGLYADFASRTLASGVIAYTPRWEAWMDGAQSKRYLLLPPNGTIDTSSMDDWIFPVGTKAWQEIRVSGKLIETRHLWKVSDTQWWEVAYAWNADGTDAVAAPDGVPDALGTTHEVLNQGDCAECHSEVRDVLTGVSAIQLGASDGDGTLAALAAAGELSSPPAPAYDVPGAGATKDALGYLHANCGHCHSSQSELAKQTPMRLRLLTTETTPEQADAYRTSTFVTMKHPIPPENVIYALVPGSPDWSGIAVRMARRDAFGMPPEGTVEVDDAGLATIRSWIASMPCMSCTSAPAGVH
jgi:hypothetical protein